LIHYKTPYLNGIMKLNSFFVAAAIAFGSSLVLAHPIDSEYYSRDLAAFDEFDAREMYEAYDARELSDEDLEARQFDDEDIFERAVPAPVTPQPVSKKGNVVSPKPVVAVSDKKTTKVDDVKKGTTENTPAAKPDGHKKSEKPEKTLAADKKHIAADKKRLVADERRLVADEKRLIADEKHLAADKKHHKTSEKAARHRGHKESTESKKALGKKKGDKEHKDEGYKRKTSEDEKGPRTKKQRLSKQTDEHDTTTKPSKKQPLKPLSEAAQAHVEA